METRAKMDFEQKGVLLVSDFTKLPSIVKIKQQPLVRNKEVYGHLRNIELLTL